MAYGRRGGEFVVNKQLVGIQYAPSVAGFASGGFIVVWETLDTLQDGAGRAVKAQRYDSLGNAVGPEMLINSAAAGDQRAPSVTTLASGGFVVTWETTDTTQDGSGRAIKGQLFDSSGLAVGAEFRINTQSLADQTKSSVSGLQGGGFVVTWQSEDSTQDGHTSAIKGQIYSAAGIAVGGEFLVNTGAVGGESSPSVTSLAGGGFVATWTLGSGTSADIYAQVFSSSGAKTGGQFRVNSTLPNNQGSPSVTEISGGRFVVTWSSWASLNTGDVEIRARIFSANGTPLGNDFLVSTTRLQPDFGFPVESSQPNVEDLPDGGFVITWTHSGGNYMWSSIRGQFFDSSGNRVGSEVLVSTVTDRVEGQGDVAVDGNGNLLAVWGSANQSNQNDDIRGQLFVASGAPEIVSNGGADSASVTAAENQNAVTIVTAVDTDGSGSLVYSIVGGLDASRFAINASTGALTFVSAPNFEARLDNGGNNVYDVVVSVSDGVNTDIQALAVTVTNVNEAPTISSSNPSDYFHRENGTAVATFSASDPDGTAPTWSIAGGPDAALFAIDPATGALRFVTAPNFEAPTDVGANNFYNVTIAASDGSLTATKALTIEIANLDEGPVIISGGGGDTASISVAENRQVATTIVADDPDARDSAYTFSIIGGADAALFTIHAQLGQLYFRNNLGANFEAPTDVGGNNVYDVIVSVSDGFNPADIQVLSITVTDANDAPVITSNGGGFLASVSMPENQLAVTTVTAADVENGPLAYSIAGGADAALFAINAQSGLLSFLAAPDREAPRDAGANHVYNVTVSVSDGDKSATQQLSITVLDVNEAPVITSNGGGGAAAISVTENSLAVTNVAATDPEGKSLSYAITGGADASRFAINPVTGALSFVTAPDREQPTDSDGNNVYAVTVGASDGVVSGSQALSITVANANERPVIVSNGGGTSASVSIDEGQTAVTTVVAADPDGAGSVIYSISGGTHAGLFVIDAATGALSFASAPDYETPPAGSANVYSVTVTASDGELSSSQSVQIGVRNVNEGVTVTSGAAQSVVENSTAVVTVAAQDLDGDSVSFAISGGADAHLFAIDPASGVLRFLGAPNFEGPADADGNNVYDVTISASDGTLSATRAFSVTVTNENEAIAFVSGGGGDQASVTIDENTGPVLQLLAVDPDGGTPFYGIAGGADAALFMLDPVTKALQFRNRPDFESRQDSDGDNVYEVIVGTSDGQTYDYQAISVTVADVYEGPVFGAPSAEFRVGENESQAGVVSAVSGDGNALSYTITGGEDSALFSIDSATGALSFVGAPDFEAPRDSGGRNVYRLTVTASDGTHGTSQAVTVVVGNVDEGIELLSYGGGDTVSLSVAENGAPVGRVEGLDLDGGEVTYSIAGGADSGLFEVDSVTGALSFVSGPDFEAAADSGGDNVYDVAVAASAGGSTATQSFAISVTNLNEGIFITSNGDGGDVALTRNEGERAVTTVAAHDPDGTPSVYSIVGGADAALFTIDAVTGLLSFVGTPDYEAPAHGSNSYDVEVGASDGEIIVTQRIQVQIRNVNEGVAITSGGGAQSFAVAVAENGTAVTSVAASDVDGDPLTYSISGGADSSRFSIDARTGALSFVQAPNFETRADADGDNVYDVVVSVTDGVFTDSQALAVTVTDVNEPVSITSNGGGAGASVAVAENGIVVTVVTAGDPDGSVLSYAIAGGADAARFTIDSSTGVLAFVAAPNFEGSADSGGDNVYDVIVSASDGSFTDSQSIAVTVGNVDEPIAILSYAGSAAVALTVQEGSVAVGDVDAKDEEDMTVTFSITGGADAALFRVDPYTGVLAFNDGVYPDFEAPADSGGNNVYDVVVTASSSTSSAGQAFAVTVANRNEGLWITSDGGGDATISVNEGSRTVTIVTAFDRDGDAPTYSILGGADAALFAIDPATGVLTFIAAPDYEAPGNGSGANSYSVEVGASDGEFTASQRFRIQVANVNEGVAITSGGGGQNAGVTVDENGLAVMTVTARDIDGDPLRYSIVGGADSSRFTIDPVTGVLRFVQAPNFESPADSGGNNVYDVVVSATDGAFTGSQAIAVTVSNVNEALAITSNGGGASASVAVAENGTAVTTVAAADPDRGTVTYAIAGGADAGRFRIDPATGALAFLSAPNFEAPADAGANNVYDVVVSASDGSFTDTQAIAVTVGNVNEGVSITSNGGGDSASVQVAENGTAVTKVVAVDLDGGAVTYAIAGGADSARFTIDPTTGVLAFVASPNFEAPGDSGGNNVYDVMVSASDGSFTDTQAIAVTVGNVNEAPVVASNGGGAAGGASVAENSVAVTIVAATDPDGSTVTYSIVGGADAARFTINAQTGALQFVVAPDWELPGDSNQDNVYAVIVRASDGQLVDDQALNVAVTNIRDGNTVTGSSAGDTISANSPLLALRTSNEEDLVFGRDGHDTIYGMAGDDEIYGEGGNDVLVGGDGADKLSGGLGKDQFTYNAVSESTGASRDLITDFSRSQGDRISLSGIDANSLVSADQAFTFIGTSAFSSVAGQLRYETSAGITTIFGDVNGDGVADLQIQLSGSIPLISSDFIL
jgi:hypothetical protein